MKAGWAAAGIAAAILAPGLAACGGGSGGTPSSPKPSAAASASSGGTGSSAGTTGPGGLTSPGSRLALGQEATVGWVPLDLRLKPGHHRAIKFQVTVKSIEKGAIADFKNAEDLDAGQRKSTPYYVMVQVKALTARVWKDAQDDPAFTFKALDDRGKYQLSHFFIGQAGSCKAASVPRPFVTGKSYTSCMNYMIPAGRSLKSVYWEDGPVPRGEIVTPYLGKPVTWSGG